MDLTPDELDALALLCAGYVAAVYVPATGELGACPNWAIDLHHCPRSWTVPQAVAAARDLAADGIDAVVVVYGVPWAYMSAGKPAQGA